MLAYIVYGYTNGAIDDAANARSSDIIDILLEDMSIQDPGPKLIAGDLNTVISRLPSLEDALRSGMLIDLGATASRFGGIDCEATCCASHQAKATRRDYVIVNKQADELVESFRVDHSVGLPVHAVLKVVFKEHAPRYKYDALHLPNSIHDMFLSKCLSEYGSVNIDRLREQRAKALDSDKRFACTVDLPPAPDSWPLGPGSGKSSKRLAQSALEALQGDHDFEDKLQQEFLEEQDACCFTQEQKDKQISNLHLEIDKVLTSKGDIWDRLLATGDTEGFMTEFSQSIEDAVANFASLDARQYKALAGRSTINVKATNGKPASVYYPDSETIESPLRGELARLTIQHRRLVNIRNCSQNLHHPKSGGINPTVQHRLREQISSNLFAFFAHTREGDGLQDVTAHLKDVGISYGFNFFKLSKACERLLCNLQALRKRQSKKVKLENKRKLSSKKTHGVISKCLKAASPAPMSCIRRTYDQGLDKPVGSFTSDPKEVDLILRHVWGSITDGNVADLSGATNLFWDKYGRYCHEALECMIGDLSVDDFKRTCLADKESAAGLDGWAARDIALLSDLAISLIVKMLNAIQKGAPWPEHMLHTRAVFLSKDPNKTDDPLAYRILKITSGWYRKWATCRNRDLRKWIATWDCPELNSGVSGKGAQDARMNTALQLELAQLSDKLVAGGSVDVYKCFDQINRQLILLLAIKAGMPRRIVEPYFRFVDNLKIGYQVGDTVGTVHSDRCSIPQGCPFSMTMIALLMVPWIHLMRELDVDPRALADDLMFTATGEGHRARTIRAMRASKQYFIDIGARVADNKCFTFACDVLLELT